MFSLLHYSPTPMVLLYLLVDFALASAGFFCSRGQSQYTMEALEGFHDTYAMMRS